MKTFKGLAYKLLKLLSLTLLTSKQKKAMKQQQSEGRRKSSFQTTISRSHLKNTKNKKTRFF
ncbi:hypothetical protein D3X12_24605 [Pseudomonas protegens]|nr:hypothetical protein CEP86_20335 [Pseudomonas protegens]QEZ53610.1 hypothetical protein D3X12_24605 [Pseudomonas protegens]QEZ60186.1 hypothetical protein D4N38_27220 [Pseudomonas protegens]QEZ64896.1 hypothetical protein D4N37_19930 [Pseudomonas protegens]